MKVMPIRGILTIINLNDITYFRQFNKELEEFAYESSNQMLETDDWSIWGKRVRSPG